MNQLLLILTWLASVIALFPACFAGGRHGPWFAMIAPLPAVAAAFFIPSLEMVTLDAVLLGVRIGLDDTGRPFLLSSALMWVVAAVYAAGSLRRSPNAVRFRVFFLLTMAGNFVLILAQDMATFFFGFTLMGLSAYGLVAHQQSTTARRAGSLYLRWTILGEVSLFCALLLMAARSGGLDFEGLQTTPPSHLAVALVLLGFGIKLALPGLHVWLPLTYSAAPAAGAAVLSGPMMSAGFLGWMRFLPAGDDALVPWGEFLIATGLVGATLGVTAGLLQRDPKVVLGYSSIGKMGVLTSSFGFALVYPKVAPLLVSALTLYVINHSMVKGALFIGIGLLDRGEARAWVLTGVVLLGLALTGAPLTGGALVKAMLTNGLPENAAWFGWWLTITALGSALLLGRLLNLLFNAGPRAPTIDRLSVTGWSALIVFILAMPLYLGTPPELLSGGLPVALGVLVSLIVWRYRPQKLAGLVGRIPPGDILHLVRHGLRFSQEAFVRTGAIRAGNAIATWRHRLRQRIISAISRLLQPRVAPTNWTMVGALWMTVGGLVILALTTGG